MKKLKKIFNIFTSVLIGLVVLIAILLVGVRIIGLKPYTVLSGSMEPNYHTGSVVYVREVPTSELVVGDTITYAIDGGAVVTHRIIELVPDEDTPELVRFRTQGDANKDADGTLVHPNNVLGKVVGTIPVLGYIAYFVQNPPGNFIAIGICVSLVILFFLPDLLDKVIKEDEEEKKENLEK